MHVLRLYSSKSMLYGHSTCMYYGHSACMCKGFWAEPPSSVGTRYKIDKSHVMLPPRPSPNVSIFRQWDHFWGNEYNNKHSNASRRGPRRLGGLAVWRHIGLRFDSLENDFLWSYGFRVELGRFLSSLRRPKGLSTNLWVRSDGFQLGMNWWSVRQKLVLY